MVIADQNKFKLRANKKIKVAKTPTLNDHANPHSFKVVNIHPDPKKRFHQILIDNQEPSGDNNDYIMADDEKNMPVDIISLLQLQKTDNTPQHDESRRGQDFLAPSDPQYNRTKQQTRNNTQASLQSQENWTFSTVDKQTSRVGPIEF